MSETNIICTQISETVSRLTGLGIGVDHVHNDRNGWYYYIPANSLETYRPLLMAHYRGPLFVVIPTMDWDLMESGDINPVDYVNEAYWNYGYFWGGGSMLGGVNWMPLEEGPGIHAKELIYRYMTILICRTHRRSCGYMPSWCNKCDVQNCPFSPEESKREGADWANEVQEKDDRYLLFKAVAAMIKNRFGLETTGCLNHNGNDNVLRIFPGYTTDSVQVEFSTSLLVDMLYHPGKYDVEDMARNMIIEAGTSWYFDGDKYVESTYKVIEADADVSVLYDFWANDRTFKRFMLEQQPEDMTPSVPTTPTPNDQFRDDCGLFAKIRNFLMGLFR